MDFKSMDDKEILEIIKAAQAELAARTPATNLVIYTHSCKNTAKYHLGKYKHWSKNVTSVDESKTNGYAFTGDFLSVTAEHKLPIGSIVVEVCGDKIEAYRVDTSGKSLLANAGIRSMSKLIGCLANALRQPSHPRED